MCVRERQRCDTVQTIFPFYLESTNIKDNDTINKDILIDIHVHIYIHVDYIINA